MVDSHLVLVPVTVTDHHGANVHGLTKDRFTLYDDRLPRPIDAFYSEDAPCAVALVVDASGSVRSRWNWERAAIHALVEAANPDDEFFATVVSSTPAVVALGGADPETIDTRLASVAPGGWTALFDGVRLAASELRRSHRPCRAIVVVSDGLDNHSRATKPEVESLLMEADVQVYAIAIAPPAQRRPQDRRGDAQSIRPRVPARRERRRREVAHHPGEDRREQGERVRPQRLPAAGGPVAQG